METEQEARTTAEAEAFVFSMFNYVFPRRFNEKMITKGFEGSDKLQKAEIHFNRDIGEAVLLICYLHGNSFLRRFLLEYPDYVDDIRTLVRYCRRYALELYDEENIFNSLLMFSAMFIEMVSYCLMQSVESGTRFANSADEHWSFIFASQFKSKFFASGGWKTLQEISQQKAYIYVHIKCHYPAYSDEKIPFHYWISDVDPETVETSVFEVGYCRIINRIKQIIQSDQSLKQQFQEIIDSSTKSDLEADTIQQQIHVPGFEHAPTSEASGSFRGIFLQENEDLKSEVLVDSGSVSENVPTSMDVEDSETKSTELGAIPKMIQRSGDVCQTVRDIFDMKIPINKKKLIEDFKDKMFYTNILDGLYIEKVFDDKEKTRILTSSCFFKKMEDTVKSRNKPDTKILLEEARSIIIEATSAALNNPFLQNQAPDISISSSEDLEQNLDSQSLPRSSGLNFRLVEKVKFPRKVHSRRSEVRNNTDTVALLETYITEALSTLKNKHLTQQETSECRNRLHSAIKSRYIGQVFQHLNSELGISFPDTVTSTLDSLKAHSTRQETSIMMELMNVSHMLTDRILELLDVLPVCPSRTQMKTSLKELISGRTGIRMAMSTLGHSCSTPTDEHRLQYFSELIKVLICECAYFLQLKWNLKRVEGYLREEKSITELENSPIREDAKQSVSQSSADVKSDNRKRRIPSKYKIVDTPTYSSGVAAADDSSNSPVYGKKLRSGAAVPVKMSERRFLKENVEDSSDSEGNKQ